MEWNNNRYSTIYSTATTKKMKRNEVEEEEEVVAIAGNLDDGNAGTTKTI